MLLKVTFSEDELVAIDGARGGLPRATWVRQVVSDVTGVVVGAPGVARRSPSHQPKMEAPREPSPPLVMSGSDLLAKQRGGGITQKELEEQRQSEAGEV